MIHRSVKKPRPSGSWVNEDRCARCGALYRDFRSGLSFAQARREVAIHNELPPDDIDTPGFWPSRGPVLWWMRVHKLNLWYQHHAGCPRPRVYRAGYNAVIIPF